MKKRSFYLPSFIITFALLLITIFFSVKANANVCAAIDSPVITGKWDMILHTNDGDKPSWLNVYKSGHMLVGEYVGAGGSTRPISRVNFSDGTITFTLPPQWENAANDLTFKGMFVGDSLSGTMTTAEGKQQNWSAVRAPLLNNTDSNWQSPITLFNGKDLSGWHTNGENQWKVKDGVLTSEKSGSNLISDQTFKNFKLHIEFRYPEGSNSGVYLRGRYEIQIEASHYDEPEKNVFSSVYGFLEPSEMTAKKAGEWQSFDVTFVGRMITLVTNGKTVINNREIPGITGGAIDSKEGEAGPIMMQGDHGPIEYRNIVITPAE